MTWSFGKGTQTGPGVVKRFHENYFIKNYFDSSSNMIQYSLMNFKEPFPKHVNVTQAVFTSTHSPDSDIAKHPESGFSGSYVGPQIFSGSKIEL